MTTTSELLFKKRPVQILLRIYRTDETYNHDLSKETGTTYAHVNTIVGKMEENGLVRKTQQGRKKIVELTEQGEELAEEIQGAARHLDEFKTGQGKLEDKF